MRRRDGDSDAGQSVLGAVCVGFSGAFRDSIASNVPDP